MEITETYIAQPVGKNWIVIDTTTGEKVATFISRKGFPADSLAFRADKKARHLNAAVANGCVVINGNAYPAGTEEG